MDDGATCLAVTNFFLRLMVWLCLKGDNYPISHTCRPAGPKQDIAIKHIGVKRIFESHSISYASKEKMKYISGSMRPGAKEELQKTNGQRFI
jgi:hypothetical protein